MATIDEFRLELAQQLLAAQAGGVQALEVNAGELYKEVTGGSSSSTEALATCCAAMRDIAQPSDEELGSSGGSDAALTIRYALPRG